MGITERVDDPCANLASDNADAESGGASPALPGNRAAGLNAHDAMTLDLTKRLLPETGFKAWR